jgi:hypothetical protein
MRVLLTGSYLSAAMHPSLAKSSMLAAGSALFSVGSGSIDDTLRRR